MNSRYLTDDRNYYMKHGNIIMWSYHISSSIFFADSHLIICLKYFVGLVY